MEGKMQRIAENAQDDLERWPNFKSHEVPMSNTPPEFYETLNSILKEMKTSRELSYLAITKADAAQKTANWFAAIAIAVAVGFGLVSVLLK